MKADDTVVSADIPSEISGQPVTAIGNRAFYWSRSLVSVTVPEGVTVIGKEAFRASGALVSVKLPESLETIKENAF